VSTLGQGTGGRWIAVDKFPTSVDAAVRFLLNVFSESEQLKIAAMTTSTRAFRVGRLVWRQTGSTQFFHRNMHRKTVDFLG